MVGVIRGDTRSLVYSPNGMHCDRILKDGLATAQFICRSWLEDEIVSGPFHGT